MVYFVSGVDTDAGKSIATGWLAKRLLDAGRRVITVKLVQTGNSGESEDIARHRAMMGVQFPEDRAGITAPEIFTYPCSPHLAARLEHREVNLEHVLNAIHSLEARYEDILVEGAGGLLVPLTETVLTLDFVCRQQWPIIFVTGGILGSISQTLLAFEALKARGATVCRVIYNQFPGQRDAVINAESCAFLKQAAAKTFPEALWEELPALVLPEAANLPGSKPQNLPPPQKSTAPLTTRPEVNTLAANLLVEGKWVLVVGGGRVGLRKAHALREAGARIRLVCPQALPEAAALAEDLQCRTFRPEDVDGCCLVLACTNDKYVNRAILNAARAACVPCCCADGGWAEADFILPATFRADGLLVSVSTCGKSCRTAKEVKNTLARFLTLCSPGTCFIHGIECAVPLPPKEVLARRLAFLNGLYGWVLLTTCNRTELLAWAAPELIQSGLLEHAMHLPKNAYSFSGEAAMHHLTMVLAGMRSHMIGEFHIVGQVRDAVEEARHAGWAHGPLQQAYAEALRRAQAVRQAVEPRLPKLEVEDLALEGATGRVVIAGTGRLGCAAVAKAKSLGLTVTVLYHTHPLPGEDCRPLKDWAAAVRGANRFITALSVPHPIFQAEALNGVPAYDLGAPRNIAGETGVRDLDALRGNYLRRTGQLEQIQSIAENAYQESLRHD